MSKEPTSTAEIVRVASYLRVSTGKQAESNLSIHDQRRQIERYCAARGWTMVEDFVEPGSSATDDRRPASQPMIDAALTAHDVHRVATDSGATLRSAEGGTRRTLAQSLLQRVEVADKRKARVLGSRKTLLKMLAISSGTNLARAGFGGSDETVDHYAFPLAL
ncbi:recombinase family protein [Sandaracinobacteroides saxicola]|uniref:Recombinase family protein n=1 Tax=Sandaracinobacteroides saxicola TaxID=2759707 RepID=A0A7G5IMV9_9SPHN|nr:recombinase family protein [Sandaracinobacteroides saxicola]